MRQHTFTLKIDRTQSGNKNNEFKHEKIKDSNCA